MLGKVCGSLTKLQFCRKIYPTTRSSSNLSMSEPVILRVLASSVKIADRAGQIVRDIMAGGQLGIVEKTGKNDLQTEADRSAQNCIVASLQAQYPDLTVVGEEGEQDLSQVPAEWIVRDYEEKALSLNCTDDLSSAKMSDLTVWVDPLDGTAEYTQGLLDHVTVLIGLSLGSRAVAGVIHQPYWNYKNKGGPIGRTFYGLVGGGVVGLNPIPPPEGSRIVATTRSHGTGLIQQALEIIQADTVLRVGGAGHKVMLLMEGQAHAYVFPSPGCKKWDTCAPEAILHAMGGKLTDMKGQTYQYHSQVEHRNSDGVLATAKASDHAWYLDTIPQVLRYHTPGDYQCGQ
ncbi:3'(2'),5'-bisphosphate nucleotidase 1 [Eurytemora carolleeae]|uniref:3'(2'),5'-bisphosphate nucleotidase 1 n=1 Tax=Eurytemora carolleeae TaxID=1294199 RepID=UPI000C77ACD9|nr:3'(2'),5'-bisphosphate nucleotidase 1 [Eurytemora carolleeae]|eukprot:XP_023335850.1 3'(2'),5'-bisphosphate nucleotidase 1-like [Eurytemora affinis]